MNTKTILWWGLAVVIAVGAWYLLVNWPSKIPGPTATPNEDVGDASFYTLNTGGERVHVEKTDTYEITATYPTVPTPKIQLAIEAAVKGEVAGFKADIATMIDATEAARIRESGRPYTFGITTKSYVGTNTTSYEFDIYEDTGGAHPNGFFKTLMFDGAGDVVELGALFKPGVRYLDRISQEAYKQVLAQLKDRIGGEVSADMEDTVRIGTSPTPETLQFFVLDGDNLVILIPPYQAAAYAAGTFAVRIPLASLSDILKPGIR
jgi:hypothetical protein